MRGRQTAEEGRWKGGENWEFLVYAWKRLAGDRKRRRDWKTVCMLTRVKENGGTQTSRTHLSSCCMWLGPPVKEYDLLLSCSFAVARLMALRQITPSSEVARELNSTRSCTCMLAETFLAFSKSFPLGLMWPAVFCDESLTFHARTGKDQDDQNQKKHVPKRHCRPRGKKRKTQKLGLQSNECVFFVRQKRNEIVSKASKDPDKQFLYWCIRIPFVFL